MINKQSSNDEVLHHLKQMELMLMTVDEEKGLNKILEIEEILGSPKVEYWIDDGVFTSSWLDDTQDLFSVVKKKLLKNHVIKEHLGQCRGFVAYNILLNKLENNDLLLMYQNGEWVFAFLNERKEQELWVNQRFNSCFFNTKYEKMFIDLIKELSTIQVDRAWLFQREKWFYTADLFEELNTVLSRLSFKDIGKVKVDSKIDEMPPLDEVFEEENHSKTAVLVEVEVKKSIVTEKEKPIINESLVKDIPLINVQNHVPVAVERVEKTSVKAVESPIAKAPVPAPLKSTAKIEDIPFGDEDLPPLDNVDFDGGLFPNVVEEIVPIIQETKPEEVFTNTQETPILMDLGFDNIEVSVTIENNVLDSSASSDFEKSLFGEETEGNKEEKNESSMVLSPVISNKGVSISPVPDKVVKKAVEVPHVPARALFGSKRKIETPGEENPVAPAATTKKGFSPSFGGKQIVNVAESEIPFGVDNSGNDED